MRSFTKVLCCAAIIATCLTVTTTNEAAAGYPVYYAPAQPVVPAVVGYSARRAGLFGRRVVVRPIVAPVAAPVVVARPVVTATYEVVPPVTVAVPVRSYRVPYSAYYPYYGY